MEQAKLILTKAIEALKSELIAKNDAFNHTRKEMENIEGQMNVILNRIREMESAIDRLNEKPAIEVEVKNAVKRKTARS